MSRALPILIAAATLAVALPPVDASAQEATSGFFDLKPLVFIIYDSSGSMSYVEKELHTPVCTAGTEKDADLTYSRSRDMIAKEVLTGTFNDFWCRERVRPAGRFDHGYPIPWYTAEYGSQKDDGVLDANEEFVKFGFLTFDTVLASATDSTGGWSLGPNSSSIPGVGLTNLGVQNDTAPFGGLVIPTSKDDFVSLTDNNALVQKGVLDTIPFGGTPISPALTDMHWLIKNHKFLVKKTGTNEGDPYATCRTKNVLLITDGRPNMGEGALGYTTSVQAAESLFKAGYKVHVVGFNLSGGTTTVVDDIAKAGGTTEAQVASTPAQLATALSSILGKAAPGLHSRTETVATNVTGSNIDLQYQINTAYSSAPTTDIDLAGYAEVTAYRCEKDCKDADSGGAGACVVTDVREELNKNTTRKLYFVLDGQLHDFKTSTPKLTADRLGIPTTGTLADLKPVKDGGLLKTSGKTLGDASDAAIRETYRKDLIALLRADAGSRRENDKLGGIYHSTPAIQTNLSNIDVQIPTFKDYKIKQSTRPTMMYTATHDGFIHAFHLSKPADGSTYKWLQEVWAIAPELITKKMNTLGTKLSIINDGRLVLKDIRLKKTSPTNDTVDSWRSVLVAPYREGGRGMIAIDVTAGPAKPKVLWEISNEKRCYLGDDGAYTCKSFDDGDKNDYRNLGKSHGKPKVGTVFIHDAALNQDHEVAAVFFPCGESVASEPESGKCFMVARLDNGEKLKEFKNGDGTVKGKSAAKPDGSGVLDFPVVGDPAAYNTFIGTFVTRLFVGDKGGQLWRIDVSSKDRKDWKMEFFFDTYYNADFKKEPITSKVRSPLKSEPAISPVAQRGQLVIVIGSGHLDYSTDLAQKTVVFSLKEKLIVDPSTGAFKSGKVSNEVNWRRILNDRENLTSKPLIFGKTVYFTSFEPNKSNACFGGTGRIWGLDYINKSGTVDPVGTFDKDGDKGTTDDVAEFVELEDSIPTGVSLISRPACAGTEGIGASVASGNANVSSGSGKSSALKASKAGQLELVVQTGSKGKVNAASKPAKGGKTPGVKKFTQKLIRPAKQVISISWGQVQNL